MPRERNQIWDNPKLPEVNPRFCLGLSQKAPNDVYIIDQAQKPEAVVGVYDTVMSASIAALSLNQADLYTDLKDCVELLNNLMTEFEEIRKVQLQILKALEKK